VTEALAPDFLIAEAKQRRRRRRLGYLAAALVAGAAAYAIDTAVGGSTIAPSSRAPAVDTGAFAGHGRVAFVSRGRLYVLAGSKLVRVTGTGASAPAFSPDGRWLAYSLRGRTGVARADGTDRRVLDGAGARWLPDGRLLVGRALYRTENGAPVRAGTAPAGLVSWSADGGRFAFVEKRIVSRNANGSVNSLELVETAPSLTAKRTIWYSAPSWFETRGGYRGNGIGGVAVLPTGGILIWLDPMHSASIAADGMPVYELRSPRGKLVRLGETVGTPLSAAGGKVALAAGGDRIAWTTKQALTCTSARCAPLRAPDGRMTVDPALSPDGRALAFVSAADLGTAISTVEPTQRRWYATRKLWLLPAGRKRPLAVPDSTGAADPVFSADGASLLFVKDDGLWLFPGPSGPPVRIATPLFSGALPNDYGQVDWNSRFAWSSKP
jgi:TolB protein